MSLASWKKRYEEAVSKLSPGSSKGSPGSDGGGASSKGSPDNGANNKSGPTKEDIINDLQQPKLIEKSASSQSSSWEQLREEKQKEQLQKDGDQQKQQRQDEITTPPSSVASPNSEDCMDQILSPSIDSGCRGGNDSFSSQSSHESNSNNNPRVVMMYGRANVSSAADDDNNSEINDQTANNDLPDLLHHNAISQESSGVCSADSIIRRVEEEIAAAKQAAAHAQNRLVDDTETTDGGGATAASTTTSTEQQQQGGSNSTNASSSAIAGQEREEGGEAVVAAVKQAIPTSDDDIDIDMRDILDVGSGHGDAMDPKEQDSNKKTAAEECFHDCHQEEALSPATANATVATASQPQQHQQCPHGERARALLDTLKSRRENFSATLHHRGNSHGGTGSGTVTTGGLAISPNPQPSTVSESPTSPQLPDSLELNMKFDEPIAKKEGEGLDDEEEEGHPKPDELTSPVAKPPTPASASVDSPRRKKKDKKKKKEKKKTKKDTNTEEDDTVMMRNAQGNSEAITGDDSVLDGTWSSGGGSDNDEGAKAVGEQPIAKPIENSNNNSIESAAEEKKEDDSATLSPHPPTPEADRPPVAPSPSHQNQQLHLDPANVVKPCKPSPSNNNNGESFQVEESSPSAGGGGGTFARNNSVKSRRIRFRDPFPVLKPAHRPRPAEDIIASHAVPEPLDTQIRWLRPKNDLRQLIVAVMGASLQRRSNACGALKVLTRQKKNQMTLLRTDSFLEAIVFAASQDIPTALENDQRELAIDARTRAIACIRNCCEPKDNRVLILRYPGFVECLMKVISDDNDGGEARVLSCGAFALLAKMPECRDYMAHTDGLLQLLSKVMSGALDDELKQQLEEQQKQEEAAAAAAASAEKAEKEDTNKNEGGEDEEENLQAMKGHGTLSSDMSNSVADDDEGEVGALSNDMSQISTRDDDDSHSSCSHSSSSYSSSSCSSSSFDTDDDEEEEEGRRREHHRRRHHRHRHHHDDNDHDHHDLSLQQHNSIRQYKEEMQGEFQQRARSNACAVLLHLSKHCPVSQRLCSTTCFMDNLIVVAGDYDSVIHTKCLEILCNLTQFPANTSFMTRYPNLVETFVNSANSGLPEDRIASLRGLQNLSADSSSKTLLASELVLNSMTSCALRDEYPEEKEAAVALLYNISTEPGAVVAITNTKNVVATFVHLAHHPESSSHIRLMACDALATISLWLQTLAGTGKVPKDIMLDQNNNGPLPTQKTSGWDRWE